MAAAAYLVPGLVREQLPAGSVSSVTVAIPVCLLVAETIARAVRQARRHAEASREAEERFELAFQNAPIGMALVAVDGRFLRVNRAVGEIVGYSPEELLARTFQDITYRDDLDADLACLAGVLAGQRRAYSMEKRYVRSDGTLVWCGLPVSLVRDADAEARHFVSQNEDISGRKRDDELLRRSNQVLERTQALARVGSWEWDVSRGLAAMHWSPEMYRLHEIEPESPSLSGHDLDQLIHPDDRAAWRQRVERAAASGAELERFTYRAVYPDGSVRWIWTQGGFDPGRPGVMLGFVQDVTDTVQTRQVLEEARDAAGRTGQGPVPGQHEP